MARQQPKFYTIVWYGERFYAAADVDAELRRASHELKHITSQLMAARLNVETIQTIYNKGNNSNNGISSEYWTAVANDGTAEYYIEPKSYTTASIVQENGTSSSSPRSTCSGSNRSSGCGGGGGGGARGRTIGKRNQEFYIPHGVLLSHTTTVHADNNDGEGDEWIGRYDKESNKIIRTVNTDVNTDNDLDEYETLKHFAQEHDRVMWQMYQERHKGEGVQEYRECNTPNVWTNPQFKFYNTVSLKWEPLSALRTDA